MDLSRVKEYLRIDYDAEDDYITALTALAEEVCLNYLRLDTLPKSSSVEQAILFCIGYFFENRTGDKQGLPQAVYTLLDPYREAKF